MGRHVASAFTRESVFCQLRWGATALPRADSCSILDVSRDRRDELPEFVRRAVESGRPIAGGEEELQLAEFIAALGGVALENADRRPRLVAAEAVGGRQASGSPDLLGEHGLGRILRTSEASFRRRSRRARARAGAR